MNANPKVSVIIPVYNVAPYLRKCLDSVLSQTFFDMEIICIDDASTDDSPKILKDYAEQYPRIKLISFATNQGVAVARNRGMDIAEGNYIGFVDADDWISPDFYEKLYQTAVDNQAELVVGNIKEISATTGKEITSDNTRHHISAISQNKIAFNQLFWLGLYQAEMLKKHNIRFLHGLSYGEDRLLPLQAAVYCNKLCFVKDAYYFYFRRPSSVTMQKISYQTVKCTCISIDKIFDFLNSESIISKEDYIYSASEFLAELQYTFSTADDKTYISLHSELQKICNKIKYEETKSSLQFELLRLLLNHPQGYPHRQNWGKNFLAVLRNRQIGQQGEFPYTPATALLSLLLLLPCLLSIFPYHHILN